MADYLLTAMHEEEGLGDAPLPQAAPPKRRRFGLAVAVLGTLGVLGAALGMRARGKPATLLQHASLVTKTFMTAFCTRQLQGLELFTADMHFLWAEEGAAEPGNMSVEAVMKIADEEHDRPQVNIVVTATPGHGKNLTAHLEQLKAALHEVIAEDDKTDAADFNRSVHIAASTSDSDRVTIKVLGPSGDWGDSALVLEASMREQLPTLRAKIAFGRTFTEMKQHLDENLLLLPGGIKTSFSTTLGMKLIAGLEAVKGLEVLGQWILPPQDYETATEVAQALEAMRFFGVNTSIRYRKDKLAKALPVPATRMVGDLVAMAQHEGTPKVLEVLYKMNASLAGLQSLEFQGMAGNLELLLNFSNVSLSTVLAVVIPEDPALLDDNDDEDVFKTDYDDDYDDE